MLKSKKYQLLVLIVGILVILKIQACQTSKDWIALPISQEKKSWDSIRDTATTSDGREGASAGIIINSHDNKIISASKGGRIIVRNQDLEITNVYPISSYISNFSVSPEFRELVINGDPIVLFNIDTGIKLEDYFTYCGSFRKVLISPRDETLVFLRSDDELTILKPETDIVCQVSEQSNNCKWTSLELVQNEINLLKEEVKNRYDATGQRINCSVSGSHLESAFDAVISTDGKVLAVLNNRGGNQESNTVNVWDLNNTQILRSIQHPKPVLSVAVSADSKVLAIGGKNGTISVWETESGKFLGNLGKSFSIGGYSDGIVSLAFSPDRTILASGSNDRTLQIWDLTTGKEVQTISDNREPVISIIFSKDGKQMITKDKSGDIKIWE